MSTTKFTLTPNQQALFDTTFTTGFTHWCGVRLLAMQPGFARLSLTPRAEMLTPGER